MSERAPHEAFELPELMDAPEVATWLRLTKDGKPNVEALYAMVARAEIPPAAVVRIGRRLRFDAACLRTWLAEKRAPRTRESA